MEAELHLPQNGCLFFPHPCFRMTWLGGTLPYLILYGSQNDVKIKAQASPTLAWTCTVATWFLLVFWKWCPSSNHQTGIVDNVWSFSFNQNDILDALDVLNDMIQREGRMIWEVIRKDTTKSVQLSCRSLPPCATVICDTHCWWWLISSWRWVVFQGLWRWRMWRYPILGGWAAVN